MVWRLDFHKDGVEAWVDEDSDRFIILLPFSNTTKWIVRCGIRSNSSQNQEALYKNRSRAMISVKNLIRVKSWRIVS